MSSRLPRPERTTVVWTIPTTLIAAAAVAILTGWPVIALVCLVAGIAAVVVVGDVIGRPGGIPPWLEPGQAADIRAERDRRGEMAAIKLLRARRPELSRAEALRLVRDL